MTVFLLLLFVLDGRYVFEKRPMQSWEHCEVEGPIVVEETQMKTGFDGWLFAACGQEPAQEVHK